MLQIKDEEFARFSERIGKNIREYEEGAAKEEKKRKEEEEALRARLMKLEEHVSCPLAVLHQNSCLMHRFSSPTKSLDP